MRLFPPGRRNRCVALAGALLASSAAHADITERALGSRGAYDTAVKLADEVGARLAGSPNADRAVKWAVGQLKALGFDARTEPVTVEAWGRGPADRVELLGPYARVLHSLALGHSPATSKDGITAEIVEVGSYEELAKLGDKVKGKIVFYDPVMKRSTGFDEYGRAGSMRFRGAVAASKAGAIAAIIRSVGTGVHRLPHAGATMYDPAIAQIPFAAISAEDAMLLHRALLRGPQRVKMTLGGGNRGKVVSANVVAEVRGTSKPDEIVVIGAHLDSWDVGDGALDDGAGVGIAMETLRLLKASPPHRTVRLVLFMNEECGLDGAKAYAQTHAAELPKHVAALEADAGGGAPRYVAVTGDDRAKAWVTTLATPVQKLLTEPAQTSDETGADLYPMLLQGVPGIGVEQDMSDYFEWHHTDGDTADKLDAAAMTKTAAAFATLAEGVANAPDTLPRVPPRKSKY